MGAKSGGVGRIHATESDGLWLPRSATQGATGVIYHHGAGGSGDTPLNYVTSAGQAAVVEALAQKWAVVSATDGGDQWGNSVDASRINEEWAWLQAQAGVRSDKVILVGTSMGGLSVLNWAAANPGKTVAVVGILPAVDLQDIHDRLFTAAIDSVYGGSYSDALYPDYNPSVRTKAKYAGMPIQLWRSGEDTVVLPRSVSQFASDSGAEMWELGGLGHSEASVQAVDTETMTRWVQAQVTSRAK